MADWFTTLTGLPDDRPSTVRAGVAVDDADIVLPGGRRLFMGLLDIPRLADLPAPPQGPQRLRLSEVVADVQALHADPASAGAVFQVASQFNLLEMVGPSVTPDQGIARYVGDRTQGPACAIACAAGTIWRNYLMPLGDQTGQSAKRQVDTLADLGAALGGDLWEMRNGYALPRPGGLAQAARFIVGADRAALTALLRVGVQADTQVTLPGAGHAVTQVYASAMPMAYAGGTQAEWEPLARLVLDGAYLATLAAAARAVARGATPRLFLTRLGGGAFGNPPGWITAAIHDALTRWAALPLEVVLVSYGRADPANLPVLKTFAQS